MPLLNDSPVKEHKKHHHHRRKHHAVETSEPSTAQGVDSMHGSGGRADLFAQKDAILAAKFPQKRNRVVPPLGSGGAEEGGGSGSKHHRSEHGSHSHNRMNRTGGGL